jgi:hypothetical protein
MLFIRNFSRPFPTTFDPFQAPQDQWSADMAKTAQTVLVTGDVIIDHHLYMGERHAPDSPGRNGTCERTAEGGAGLIHRILSETGAGRTGSGGQEKSYSVQFGLDPSVYTKLGSCQHAYALWKPFPHEKQIVWRLDKALGYGDPCTGLFPYIEHLNPQATPHPAVLVIDDGGLGFRNSTQKAAWPKILSDRQAKGPEWIVLKMSSPVGQGDLWRLLSTEFPEKLVTVISIGDIRKEEVRVSSGISWERTALDLAEELCINAAVQKLLVSGHLVIHFGSEGALHVENKGGDIRFELIYDPANMEFEWRDQVQGQALGFMACLCSGITDRLLSPASDNPILEGIQAGLSAMRTMHLAGHGKTDEANPGFPFKNVAGDILAPAFHYSCIRLPNPEKMNERAKKNWTIMTAVLEGVQKNPRPLYGIGRRVALLGPRALTHIPFSRFGKLFTVDRNEIESLRNIRGLIQAYEKHDPGKKPLSLAVFGPPGSGKSFGIKEIAKGILGKDVPILEFNLSQFKGPDDLTGAFHQVRDKALQGVTPVVFWDEFDSKELSWLQYLLAPMQDGAFQEGQIIHPIGKCIFIFAGGTSVDMEHFGPGEGDNTGIRDFQLKKGPDFKSRLSGYLNVLGPNQRQNYVPSQKEWGDVPEDICFPVRRALLIRAVLGVKDDKRLEIDRGILSALIEINRYKHGARSLEKIVLQVKNPGIPAIRRSDLPAADILSLHADSEAFLAIVNRDLAFKTHAESLAPFVHEFFRDLGRKENWLKKEMDVPYDSLPEDYKEDNRAAAARIPQVLDLVGLYVVPENFPSPDNEAEMLEIVEQNIELLAEAEHNGWADHKKQNGWMPGETRDDAKRIHNCLGPYSGLSEKDKNKDRNSVRKYPAILKQAKFKIVSNLSGK